VAENHQNATKNQQFQIQPALLPYLKMSAAIDHDVARLWARYARPYGKTPSMMVKPDWIATHNIMMVGACIPRPWINATNEPKISGIKIPQKSFI
jgi:hypothetical protein